MKTSIVLIARIKCCRLAENPAVYEKVIALLRNNNVQYEEMVHPPVKTSAEVWIQIVCSCVGGGSEEEST